MRKGTKYIVEKHKCPICDSKLGIVLHGLVQETYLNQLKENNVLFYNAGCMCYGDDRDGSFHCSACGKQYDDKLNEIILIQCPRVVDYKIRQEDCGDNELLEKKYILYDKQYCVACKMILSNEDDEYRKAAEILELPKELVEKVIVKKNSNHRLKRNINYKCYLCGEEELMRRLEHWDM